MALINKLNDFPLQTRALKSGVQAWREAGEGDRHLCRGQEWVPSDGSLDGRRREPHAIHGVLSMPPAGRRLVIRCPYKAEAERRWPLRVSLRAWLPGRTKRRGEVRTSRR